MSEPELKESVPVYLRDAYDVPLVDGKPCIDGLALARERAASVLSEGPWRVTSLRAQRDAAIAQVRGEKAREAIAQARDKDTRAERIAYHEAQRIAYHEAQQAHHEAELAQLQGEPVPYAQEAARAAFASTLFIETDLPWYAIACLAWWDGWMPERPKRPRPDQKETRDPTKTLRRLVGRRFQSC